jgi:hypothetical protein
MSLDCSSQQIHLPNIGIQFFGGKDAEGKRSQTKEKYGVVKYIFINCNHNSQDRPTSTCGIDHLTLPRSSNTMSTSGQSPDAEAVRKVLYELKSKLEEQNVEGAKETLQKLSIDSNPKFTTDFIAPCLFLGQSDSLHLNHQEALTQLMYLATCDPVSFLKPASRAVKNIAELLAATPSTAHQPVTVSDDLLHVLVAQLSGIDVEVSSNATAALTACGRRLGPPLSERAITAIVATWRPMWDDSHGNEATIVCVRCASAVIDLVILADASMEAAVTSGAMDLLLVMMTDEADPLLQMSILDLLEKLATTLPMHGTRARWLFSTNLLHELLQMAGGTEGVEYPDPILGGPALRLLATLCRLSQRDASLFGLGGADLLLGFHRALRQFDGASGELDRLALVDAISSFASASPEALEGIINDPITRDGWLSLAVAQPKLKSVILYSVAMVMDPPLEKTTGGDSVITVNVPTNALTMRLYSSIGQTNGGDATRIVLSIAKSPFIETRMGAYALLAAFAKRGTGAQVLLSHPGFYEFLISREGETTKEGKEAKYSIVQAVLGSDARGLLADRIVNALEKILGEGPHFVQSQRFEVMTE